ncbi:flippase-like domain-containing protein [filamentous cyanobacterium LEGE 11480]|uniref:Flippase-like domain-containing protein n=1 Tax=Romeriopsis navalis LEGE 11480 TaxID=2777977 RepID=A0A928Z2W9_9CYAN|nr:lysylphosphatidylglycerol synthase domain-containing protein [Romeriopsis navalis]MBE9029477.1 flippase-like domain-containing protein [Romeriopsis navalis LEGE 11480]
MSKFRVNWPQFLRWGLIGAVLFFLGRTLWQNWQTVASIRITTSGWGLLTIGLAISLLAHCLAGAIWTDILRMFQTQQSESTSITSPWGIKIYLTTNLAKYLPGNVWHFYGRFNACKQINIPAGNALLSILLEPLLMAVSGLVVVIAAIPFSQANVQSPALLAAQFLGLGAVLVGIHPKILNRVLRQVGGAKRKRLAIAPENIPQLQHYPIRALMGELGFVLLRGTGFVITWSSIHRLELHQLPIIYSSFAIAWLLGLVVPGLPGGIGLFEAVTIALLNNQLSTGELLAIVALYRVVNTLAETIGAGFAQLLPQSQRLN